MAHQSISYYEERLALCRADLEAKEAEIVLKLKDLGFDEEEIQAALTVLTVLMEAGLL